MGGTGTRYEAARTPTGQRVALKLLQAHAAAIGHPNIATVFDTGGLRGRPFLVMELLRCETACRVAARVLSALASTPARGIIHRDLKPENVFLLLGGAAPSVKLLDFAVAKFHRLDDSLRTPTLEGAQLGTPAYMAPEQWMGRRDLDHRADLFAVGVLLYEMLTVVLPFQGRGRGGALLPDRRRHRAPAATERRRRGGARGARRRRAARARARPRRALRVGAGVHRGAAALRRRPGAVSWRGDAALSRSGSPRSRWCSRPSRRATRGSRSERPTAMVC
jgi:hypothetical protein